MGALDQVGHVARLEAELSSLRETVKELLRRVKQLEQQSRPSSPGAAAPQKDMVFVTLNNCGQRRPFASSSGRFHASQGCSGLECATSGVVRLALVKAQDLQLTPCQICWS